MRRYLLEPLGRAEPDSVQGWLEQGGGRALQRALAMEPVQLRALLESIERRDGRGPLRVEEGRPVAIEARCREAPDPTRLILEEMPAWLVEGSLLLAMASGEPDVTIHIGQASHALWSLLSDLIARFESFGITGASGIARGISCRVVATEALPESMDAVTALLLPVVVWNHHDPATTLLAATGAVGQPGVYEIPLGLSVRDFLYTWAGGPLMDAPFYLGERLLGPDDVQAALTYDNFGSALGAGRLHVGDK